DHTLPYPTYGFDHLEISDEPGPYEDAYRAWVRRKAPDQLDKVSLGLPPTAHTWRTTMRIKDSVKHPFDGGARFDNKGATPFSGTDDVTYSAFVGEQTIEYIKQQQVGSPFLCISSFYSPHSPWIVPQTYLDMYDPDALTIHQFPAEVEETRPEDKFTEAELRSAKHGYYAMITEVDYYVGQILDQLEKQGLADNTIVVFTSDHGEWLGEHLRYGKGHPGADVVSRVPLIVRWPKGTQTVDQTRSEIVEALDVLPTLLECVGIQIPPFVQGRSFADGVFNDDFTGRKGALMEHAGWKNLRTANYRYLLHDDGQEMLWDIDQDRQEYKNVADDERYASVLAEHRHLMLQRLIAMERPLPRSWTY
ncbi:MAG: sulfatase-like hydrolase/transferase, partial [Chloroflexota bacterium]